MENRSIGVLESMDADFQAQGIYMKIESSSQEPEFRIKT